jgi:hypothetical protein
VAATVTVWEMEMVVREVVYDVEGAGLTGPEAGV